ncbi:cytochrome c-type biogenesis protein [Rhodovulum adriaticum]|uniref:Cytochrome c-type biogenesis protein n=1 Tax=Rhodovulum adriaticum TaxID=35804 RepID=A0A4R2NUV8_RHOAD|nr:cytochrome c-type biogenesis protein [Rhodovulum adriaticum]MBK1635038.1 cytochrome C biogenesis protein CcdA [Rhodovulum adriaticum]TCP25328.1 cytochrome c-type biogenesis protein CcmH [Rhodovulum adriaticum]
MLKRLILALALTLPLPALAVEPAEMLDDPAQEARAREVSKELRCLVCRNENIDDSNASLAKELRLLVRDRITEGDSNEEVIEYVVDRYGEYVLLKPTVTGSNLLLYIAGPAMLLIGFIVAMVYIRGRSRRTDVAADGLSPEEEARLKEIMGGK